jgi:predicted DNA-binding transcriptional regulator AlpA
MRKYTSLPHNLPPRLLGRAAAAAYVNVCGKTFDSLVAIGTMPEPKRLGQNCIAWDVRDLDAAVNELPRRNARSGDDGWGDIDAA